LSGMGIEQALADTPVKGTRYTEAIMKLADR
jgi:hypothetical protein